MEAGGVGKGIGLMSMGTQIAWKLEEYCHADLFWNSNYSTVKLHTEMGTGHIVWEQNCPSRNMNAGYGIYYFGATLLNTTTNNNTSLSVGTANYLAHAYIQDQNEPLGAVTVLMSMP